MADFIVAFLLTFATVVALGLAIQVAWRGLWWLRDHIWLVLRGKL